MKVIDDAIRIFSDLKSHCNCEFGPAQAGALPRELEKKGYTFLKINGRTAFKEYCPRCNKITIHRKILSKDSVYNKNRIILSPAAKKLFFKYNKKCVISGSTHQLEIDHKITPTIGGNEVPLPNNFTLEHLMERYQVLSRPMNQLKRERCNNCIKTSIRPPAINGISFYYFGDEKYENTCYGCYWYDVVKWNNEFSLKYGVKFK